MTLCLIVACALATFLPQGAAAERYFSSLPSSDLWRSAAATVGFTHIFSSWWFIGLLFILASGVAVCAASRLAVARHATGVEIRRGLASALTHLSLLLIFAGGVVRVVFGELGTINLREGEATDRFTHVSGTTALPFAMRFEQLHVEFEAVPRDTASATAIAGSVVKDARSSVEIVSGGRATRAIIGVNQPLVRDGYRVYQVGDPARHSGVGKFQVVRDPGMPLVYTGFGLLLAGLVFTLYINPWLNSRRTLA